MHHSIEFDYFMRGYSLVTVNVLYFLPDHSNILNEFLWQTLDLRPKYPRFHKILGFWKQEIDAVIKEVIIMDTSFADHNKWRHGILLPLN